GGGGPRPVAATGSSSHRPGGSARPGEPAGEGGCGPAAPRFPGRSSQVNAIEGRAGQNRPAAASAAGASGGLVAELGIIRRPLSEPFPEGRGYSGGANTDGAARARGSDSLRDGGRGAAPQTPYAPPQPRRCAAPQEGPAGGPRRLPQGP